MKTLLLVSLTLISLNIFAAQVGEDVSGGECKFKKDSKTVFTPKEKTEESKEESKEKDTSATVLSI
jgi:hypothetical protein